MLALQQGKGHQGTCTPNVLPCKINHNGPVNASPRYWHPTAAKDGKSTAYFRGRKLQGRAVRVPASHRGAVMLSTEKTLPAEARTEELHGVDGDGHDDGHDDDDGEEEVVQVGVIEEVASFDEFVVWGHEVCPDGSADPYVRGVEEWIGFAEKIHAFAPDESKLEKALGGN